MTLATAGADLRDNRKNDVFGRNALRQFAFDIDGHGLERLEAQRLRGHDVLDLGSADAKRHRTERTVRGGVRIAAHDGHARLRKAQYRSERMHHALIRIAERTQANTELLAVLLQRAQLQRGGFVRIRAIDVNRGGVVVLRGDQLIDMTRLATSQTQALERLRTGDLMHEHQVDVQQVGSPIATFAHQMIGPDFLGQCRSHTGPPRIFPHDFPRGYCLHALFVL